MIVHQIKLYGTLGAYHTQINTATNKHAVKYGKHTLLGVCLCVCVCVSVCVFTCAPVMRAIKVYCKMTMQLKHE